MIRTHAWRFNRRAQNIIEYSIIVAVVTTAVLAMSTYVFRAVQATQQMIQEGANP